MIKDEKGQIVLTENQSEQLKRLVRGLRDGEMIYLNDNDAFEKAEI
jgi:hypothetical protein